MPGIGLEIDGAMQHAPQLGRQAWSAIADDAWDTWIDTARFLKHEYSMRPAHRT
jgi:hypothetical protein